MTTSLPRPTQPRYTQADWRKGYESQRQETSYWIEDIVGAIPTDLTGTLFRNGPGLLDIAGHPIKHPFDGDGMVCSIRFKNGQAYFQNRYVQTQGYIAEKEAKKPLYRGVFGTQKPGGWLANIFDTKAKNIANTNILYWGNKLLALWEGGLPHRLNPQTLETIGLDQLDGLLEAGQAFAAHPRIDPHSTLDQDQPCLINFSVTPGLATTITTFEFAPDGQLLRRNTAQVRGFAFLHDMAITPSHCIFFQNPVSLNPLPFLLGLKGAGECIDFNPKLPTKIILMPRSGGEPEIYETEPCFVFHHSNAWESGDEVIVDSICYANFPALEEGTDFLDVNFDRVPPSQLWRFRINRKTGQVSHEIIESRSCEFPVLHPDRVGRSYRYVYAGAAQQAEGNAPLQAVLKLDLETGDRQLFSLAPRGFAGEPIFVPRPNGQAEDDGWLLLLAYDAAEHRSKLFILDAQDLNREPIAILGLKYHIPYGLHGSFTPHSFGDDFGDHQHS